MKNLLLLLSLLFVLGSCKKKQYQPIDPELYQSKTCKTCPTDEHVYQCQAKYKGMWFQKENMYINGKCLDKVRYEYGILLVNSFKPTLY